MAILKKANREINVKDEFVDGYLQRGYDLLDESGKVIKTATGGKTVSLPEYNKVLKENERLKKQIELSKLSGDELKAKLDVKEIPYAANDSKESLIAKLLEGDE